MTPAVLAERRHTRQQRVADGQCVACDRRRDTESPRCAACRAYQAEKMRQYRGAPPPRRLCPVWRRAMRAARYARGLCVHCPQPRLMTSSRCAACLQKAADYDARKRALKETRPRP